MANQYTVNAGVACGTTLPIVNITGSASVRIRLYEMLVGFSTSPADVATLFKLLRTTDAGTGGTSLTIYKNDPLSATATGTAKSGTFSGAPTATDELMRLSVNQRNTVRWIARETCEFYSTAASANGIMLRSESSGGTPNADASFYWLE